MQVFDMVLVSWYGICVCGVWAVWACLGGLGFGFAKVGRMEDGNGAII